jgi:hypothetical protein
MDQATPAPKQAHRFRWLGRVCWVLFFLVSSLVIYLVVATPTAFYSPADKLRPNTLYDVTMNPQRWKSTNTPASPAIPPTVTLKTNQGNVWAEYPWTNALPVDVASFTLQRLEGGEVIKFGGITFRLLRIGHVWVPPSTNKNGGWAGTVPATFYGPDLKPLSADELQRDLPKQWDRLMDSQVNRPAYRFDLEVHGGPSKVIGAKLIDARTHSTLQTTGSFSSNGSGHKNRIVHNIGVAPYLWHATPVELVVDLALGPIEEEEILPQAGASFTVGGARYGLIFADDKLVSNFYHTGTTANRAYLELALPGTGQPANLLLRNSQPLNTETILMFVGYPPAAQTTYEMEYLDAGGKAIGVSGGRSNAERTIIGVHCALADIKKIRVRKYQTCHRLVISLPYLPGLPPENQHVKNLFQVRAPLLRFDQEFRQAQYIGNVTQLEMPSLRSPNLLPHTYPRWFTNATAAEVLQDYERVMGVPEQLQVNQEQFKIEKGQQLWPFQVQEKVVKLWKKLTGP